MISRSTAAAQFVYAATIALLSCLAELGRTRRGPASGPDDRGDVPGWVMVTMMTAIVVIVLLGVFQEAVVNAVKNAFDSISGQGGQP